jgi:asparagine synthetase B (glutamine-hydrolysing)
MTSTVPRAHPADPTLAADLAAIDWLVQVHRRTGALTIRGGHGLDQSPLTVFVAGDVVAVNGAPSDGTSRLSPAVVLASLRGDVERGIAALRGQFVVAVAEAGGATRVLRDPLGSYPLFYAERADAVLFAARPQVLLAQPGVSRDLNRAAIADHLCKRWPDDQETFFSAVRRVPPGWQVVVSRGVVEARRYWFPTNDPHHIEWLTDDDVEEFDALLDRAVARGLNRGRAGVFLSGGFDSVSVAAVALDVAGRTDRRVPLGLSLGFPDPSCDERPVQRAVAERLGMPLTLLDFHDAAGAEGLMRRGLDLNARLAAPLFNNWLPAYLSLVDRARAAGIDTILTGEGGDEWLGSTPFLAADLWRRGNLLALSRLTLTWHRSYDQTWPRAIRGAVWQYGLRPLTGMLCHAVAPRAWDDRRARKVVRAIPGWISPDPALRALQYERARRSLPAANPPGGFYSRESRQVLGHPLTSWLFEEQFALGRPLGVRYVHPYWDADLVAHAYRIHPARLNAGNRTKALVRQTVDRRFPNLGFERQRKVGALDFFSSLVRREAPALALAVSDFKGLASLDIVVPAATRAYLDYAWRASPWHVGAAWNIVNMEVWIRRQLQPFQEGCA